MGVALIRFKRTTLALHSIGGATLGSAITTIGAAFFLTFCKLTLFERLGSMCLILTLISVVVALVSLPAALYGCGPLRPGTCCVELNDPAEPSEGDFNDFDEQSKNYG